MLKEQFLKENKKQIITLTLLNGNQLRGRLINYDGECICIAIEEANCNIAPGKILIPYSSVLLYSAG